MPLLCDTPDSDTFAFLAMRDVMLALDRHSL
jgi:hypothetical protein